MPPENARDRKTRKYTLVVIPDAKSEKTRTLSVTKWGLFGSIIAVFIAVFAAVIAVLVYTPAGIYIQMANPEIEKRYEREIADIQSRLKSLVNEVMVMRDYNVKLRNILGENISPMESTRLVTEGVNSGSWLDSLGLQGGQESAVRMENYEGQFRDSPGEMTEPALPLTLPVSGYVTEKFDPDRFHYGIDFSGKKGNPVFAAADGSVVFSGWTYDDGFVIILMHELGYATAYKHNNALIKNIGDIVRRGEAIAFLGNTGERSGGAHLHFEVWKNSVVQDPSDYLLVTN